MRSRGSTYLRRWNLLDRVIAAGTPVWSEHCTTLEDITLRAPLDEAALNERFVEVHGWKEAELEDMEDNRLRGDNQRMLRRVSETVLARAAKQLVIRATILLVFVTLLACSVQTPRRDAGITPSAQATLPTPEASPPSIKIFLVALGDEGRAGERIGCGDSVVGVDAGIASSTDPLRAAMEKLLSLHDPTDPGTGLHNALAYSSLTVEKSEIKGGDATVRLTGTLALTGVCHYPRVEAQLEKTAGQFPGVRTVTMLVNDCPLSEFGREDDRPPHPDC